MLMTAICPACETGELRATQGDTTITYDGQPLVVRGVHFSVCAVCGEEVVLAAQAKLNDVLYADAKKAHDDLWSCDRIASFRAEWGLSQQDAARLFGGGANAFSKYERGEVIHSRAMDLLMRVFEASGEARQYLGQRCGLDSWQRQNWQLIQEVAPEIPRATSRKLVVELDAYRRQAEQARAANEVWQDQEEELTYGAR